MKSLLIVLLLVTGAAAQQAHPLEACRAYRDSLEREFHFHPHPRIANPQEAAMALAKCHKIEIDEEQRERYERLIAAIVAPPKPAPGEPVYDWRQMLDPELYQMLFGDESHR